MLKLDHVVVKVQNLEAAIARYEGAGFTVTRGGEHPAFGSVNALVPFEDDSYLELIAFPGGMRPEAADTPPGKRVVEWARRGEGAVDWALVPDDIDAEIARLRAAGQAWHEPLPGQRLRRDGRLVQWLFGTPQEFLLPFMCADVTPRELRVPPGAARRHANGASGIGELTVAVRAPDAYAEKITQILVRPGMSETGGAVVLESGSWRLRVAPLAPEGPGVEGLVDLVIAGWAGW